MNYFLLLLLAIFSLCAFADDTVTLSNGKQVKGTIIEDNESTLLFEVPSGKRYRLEKTKIKGYVKGGGENRTPASTTDASTSTTSVNSPFGFSYPYKLGFQFGPSFSGISNSNVSLDGVTGLCIGFTAEVFQFHPLLFIQPELMYEQLGASFTILGVTSTFAYDVIRLPILLKVKIGIRPEDTIKFVGFVGPSFALKVGSSVSTSGTPTVAGTTVTASGGTTNASAFDLGFEIGAGVEYAFNKQISFLGNVRYDLGVSNVDSTPNATDTMNTRDVQFLFGAMYKL
jgi:hypothetical protein